jgi:hypothetical protein
MTNITSLQKKLDRLTEWLGALDIRVMSDTQRSAVQMRLMKQSADTIIALAAATMSQSREIRKEAHASAARTGEILAETRKH